ncbi:MAG: hypothetical protein WA705_22490 [Candidatus Ozemobacteraceae bacterium]
MNFVDLHDLFCERKNGVSKGMVLVVVVFFIFATMIGLFMIVQTNTYIGFQNKKALRQLQAYYLAQSGLQHMLLKLKLLPREAYEVMKDPVDGAKELSRDVDSENHLLLSLQGCSPQDADKYTLFDDAQSPSARSPYPGSYHIDELEVLKSHMNLKFAQDSYRVRVQAYVEAVPKTEEIIDEEIIISRFTGGIGGAP